MITSPSPALRSEFLETETTATVLPTISWKAILAGLTAAIALEFLFMLLGSALGFAIYTPLTDSNPTANLSEGAAVIEGISAVFALWFGGWVAGRFVRPVVPATGWLHGFLVWCAATVAGIMIASGGAAWAMGDLSKLVGGGLSAAGKPAAAAVGNTSDLTKDAAKQSGDSITSFTNEAVASQTSQTPAAQLRSKREIGLAVARFFNPTQDANKTENRAALIKTISDTGVSQPDAEKMVNAWSDSYQHLQTDLKSARDQAALKARETAEQAAHDLAILSLCAFLAFAIGAVAAGCGGELGAKFTLKHISSQTSV